MVKKTHINEKISEKDSTFFYLFKEKPFSFTS